MSARGRHRQYGRPERVKVAAIVAADERAAQLEQELTRQAEQTRAEVTDWRVLYEGLDHVVPAALRIEVPL